MSSILKALAWAFLALALASCKTPPHRQQFPEITFQHLQPFRLDVAYPFSNEYGRHSVRVHFSIGQMF